MRLVSVMAANNEVGTVQPLAEVAEVVRRHAPDAVLHTDAVQALCWLDLDRRLRRRRPGVASAPTSSAGRRASACCWSCATACRSPRRQLGGGQERGRRSGTQNVPGIVAAAVAARLTAEEREPGGRAGRRSCATVSPTASLAACPAWSRPAWSRPVGPDRRGRVAGVCHVCIEGIESEALLFLLERADVSTPRPRRRARAAPWRPPTCWRPWACPPTWRRGRCACRSAGRPPTPRSTTPWPRSRRRRARSGGL